MAASTAAVDHEAERRPILDDPARASLREAIRSEVARARARPVAVRTLELMAEAASEPGEAAPGYRVLDRHGDPRLHADTAEPLTLADLVAEMQARHPALFLTPEPEPPPEPQPAEARDSRLVAGASEMRAATARFVETQSERFSARRRAFAESAAGTLAGWRARFARPASVPQTPGPAAAEAWNAGPGRIGESLRDGLHRLRDRFGGLRDALADEADHRHRRWFAGATAAALVAVVAAGLILAGHNEPGGPPAATEPASPPSSLAPVQEARGGSVPDTVTPPPETGGEPEPEPAPPAANALTGPAQVIDTATLKVGGKVVHLFGVEWVRGGQGEELARYIAGRPVSCQPAPGSESMNCLVDGRDISEVVLFNGGGRASPEASPDLAAAEDHARSERLGVWKR